MTTYISYIFWGLLIVILDFTINQFDLLPDFIGYILVSIGSNGLIVASGRFTIARNSCWALVALSLIELIVERELGVILGIIHMIVNCTMMWFLLGGFMDIAISYNRQDLAEKASTRRTVYVILMCVASLLGFIAHETRDAAVLIVIVIVVAMLILVVMILHLIYQVKSITINNSKNNSHPDPRTPDL